MLLFALLYGATGSAAGFAVWRLVKTRDLVHVARTDVARSRERAEGARRAALMAEAGRAEAVGQAREALAQTGQALDVARGIQAVSEQVQDLSDYLVTQIEGEQPQGGRGRHALPGDPARPAIAGETQEEATA